MEKLISTETREKKVLSMVFLTISLCILANNFLSFINTVIRPGTTGNIIFIGAFTLSNIIIAISAVILAIKCRGVFSIIGGIFLAIATLMNLVNASFAHAFTLSVPSLLEFLIGNNIIEDPATLFMFYEITGFVSIIVNFLCLVAYILLAVGTRTSKIFKTTIVATGTIFLFMTVANNYIVPVIFSTLLGTGTPVIYYHIYDALVSAIQIVIIAICIFEYISANRQAKSCQE